MFAVSLVFDSRACECPVLWLDKALVNEVTCDYRMKFLYRVLGKSGMSVIDHEILNVLVLHAAL
jgi:hypothetical protein